jgi:CRP-like cAMP-binding protein
MRHARLRRYAPGERLYRIGDGADGLYGIVSGFVRLVSYPEAGRELVAGVMSGGWFGEVAVLDGGVRPHDAIASGDVVVAKLGLFAWQALARETPAFTADLARLGCLHIRRQMAEIDALMTFGSEGRLSRLLVQLGDAGKRDSGRCRIELSQTSLADLTGISRQHLNRLLRVMEAERLIRIGYSCIEVLDPARLLVHDGR